MVAYTILTYTTYTLFHRLERMVTETIWNMKNIKVLQVPQLSSEVYMVIYTSNDAAGPSTWQGLLWSPSVGASKGGPFMGFF
jgi:hypothetical protein